MRANAVEAFFVSAVLLCAIACTDDAATSPSQIPTLTGVVVSGTTSSSGTDRSEQWLGMVPGEVAQLKAIATYSDGRERDVTADAAWVTTRGSGVVRIVSPGVIRAEVPGWMSIHASYGSGTSSIGWAFFRVAPEGTFLLSVVVDEEFSGPAVEALVQVRSSVGTFNAKTDLLGIVAVPAVGETELRVEKPGWATVTERVTVSADGSVLCVLLPSVTEPAGGGAR
jgi:hypothetical protein